MALRLAQSAYCNAGRRPDGDFLAILHSRRQDPGGDNTTLCSRILNHCQHVINFHPKFTPINVCIYFLPQRIASWQPHTPVHPVHRSMLRLRRGPRETRILSETGPWRLLGPEARGKPVHGKNIEIIRTSTIRIQHILRTILHESIICMWLYAYIYRVFLCSACENHHASATHILLKEYHTKLSFPDATDTLAALAPRKRLRQ